MTPNMLDEMLDGLAHVNGRPGPPRASGPHVSNHTGQSRLGALLMRSAVHAGGTTRAGHSPLTPD